MHGARVLLAIPIPKWYESSELDTLVTLAPGPYFLALVTLILASSSIAGAGG